MLLRCRRAYSKLINVDKDPVITDRFAQIRDHYNTPKYPLVLCHGFSGFDKLTFIKRPRVFDQVEQLEKTFPKGLLELDYWRGIRESLEKLGSTVLTGRVPPFGTIHERAVALEKFIDEQCEILRKNESKKTIYLNRSNKVSDSPMSELNKSTNSSVDSSFDSKNEPIKLNLILHSMGGLDCRYMISRLGLQNYKVVSLTTISTPHHGSECADFIIELVKRHPSLANICPKSVYELTCASMEKFNAEVKDDPSVAYFSYGARFDPRWYNAFNFTWQIMRKKSEIDNDGMVSTLSAHWGKYVGTLNGVDHLDLINWTNSARKVVDRMLGEKEKFNANALYLDIADHLAKRGF